VIRKSLRDPEGEKPKSRGSRGFTRNAQHREILRGKKKSRTSEKKPPNLITEKWE